MRKKKLFVLVAVMLLVVFMLSIALVACKKKPVEEETPSGSIPSGAPSGDPQPPIVIPPPPVESDPEPTIPSYAKNFRGAVGYMVDSMPSDYLSMNFTGSATVRGKKYVMSLKGNLAEDDIQVSIVFKPEGSNDLAFGIYIIDSKLFFELEDGSIYNIAEIDANYLASIVDKLPDKLSGIINDALGNISAIIPTVLDLLLNGLSPSKQIVYTEENGVEKFTLALDIQGFLAPITNIVKPDGILGMFLPADLNLDLGFVAELLNMVPLINGQLNATVDNGKLTEFKVELYDNDPESETYQQTLIGVDSALTFSSTPLTIDVPEGLENYETLTLGNLNA